MQHVYSETTAVPPITNDEGVCVDPRIIRMAIGLVEKSRVRGFVLAHPLVSPITTVSTLPLSLPYDVVSMWHPLLCRVDAMTLQRCFDRLECFTPQMQVGSSWETKHL